MVQSKQVLIVAAEASSGLFAQRLIEHYKKQKRDFHFFGVGTREMENLGFERLGKSEEMAVVGAVEVYEALPLLKQVYAKLVEEVKKRRPSVIILMDYPGFNLKLAKELHSLGIPIVYYITPQVWAWKKGRVKVIEKYVTKTLVILPFEKDFFTQHGVQSEFVGHPLLDEIRPELMDASYRKLQRSRRGVGTSDFLLGLMPGSRRGELKLNFPVQLQTAALLKRKYPNLKIMVFVAPTLEMELVKESLEGFPFEIQVIKDDPVEMIVLADFILVASGTATLLVSLVEVPMVIMYRLRWLTGVLARILVRGIQFFGLPNLIVGREIVPERWQSGASPQKLAEIISVYISNPEKLEMMKAELKGVRLKLGEGGATARVAQALEEYLK